jgi:hypothetical protein
VLVDVINDLVRDIITDALSALTEKADLGGRDIVLDELGNNTNVVLPLLQADKGVIWQY